MPTKEERLGVENTGTGMTIVMKKNATKRQIELAKKFYPNAIIVIEESEEE